MDSKSDNLKKVESLLIRKVSGNRFFPLFQSLAQYNLEPEFLPIPIF
ncbi:21841_t:CDS:2 [Rhizophagus irregularis]|nr:21841_t:CDS:2 [Rhizophagus irregularis]